MRASGKYELAEQAGDAGFYAEVVVRLEIEDGKDGLSISYPGDLESDGCLAVGFGIAYAREHLRRELRLGRRMSVTVETVNGHVVDTTTMALAFAAAKALWNACGVEGPEGFSLDATARMFHVPK